MAPKGVMKKKLQSIKKKPTKKVGKFVAKPVEEDSDDHDSKNDSDGSLDAIEFDSE